MRVVALPVLVGRIVGARRNVLIRQNSILFLGGLVAGVSSFVYHAIAGRTLGPAAYGHVAFLIATYAVFQTFALILSLVLARHTASLVAGSHTGIGSVLTRAAGIVAIPCLGVVLLIGLMANPIAAFAHMPSAVPVLILGAAVGLGWQLAIPRGLLQGLQRFKSLALNLALEPIARVSALVALIAGGYAVAGAVGAVVAGLIVGQILGIYSLRDRLAARGNSTRLGSLAGFSLAAAAGVVGIQLLFNQDVVLAEHYLPRYEGGIYGGLNKIGTIMFYLTLSVSQVLFPRVVDALARQQHPGRLLLSSVGILTALGVGALLVFAVAPGLVVNLLYGPAFRDATPYVLASGVIGLALSLDNMLLQFFLAVRDLWFVPILAVGCAIEAGLIVQFHETVWQVVDDVLLSLIGILVLFAIRSCLIVRALRAGSTGRTKSLP